VGLQEGGECPLLDGRRCVDGGAVGELIHEEILEFVDGIDVVQNRWG